MKFKERHLIQVAFGFCSLWFKRYLIKEVSGLSVPLS